MFTLLNSKFVVPQGVREQQFLHKVMNGYTARPISFKKLIGVVVEKAAMEILEKSSEKFHPGLVQVLRQKNDLCLEAEKIINRGKEGKRVKYAPSSFIKRNKLEKFFENRNIDPQVSSDFTSRALSDVVRQKVERDFPSLD